MGFQKCWGSGRWFEVYVKWVFSDVGVMVDFFFFF